METLITILLMPVTAYLAVAGIYQLVLALASQSAGTNSSVSKQTQNRFLVLVPAYREDEIILHSTRRNLSMRYHYHKDLFDYVVISDQLKAETNRQLTDMGAIVLPVQFDRSTKVKSLQAAISKMDKDYDGVVILDADNVAAPAFLAKANQYLYQGHSAIQGQRTADRNTHVMALLDGFAETANNAMLCKGANRLGLSSKLSGSGMIFCYTLFREVIFQLEAIGGFDKEMELLLTRNGHFIKYASDLIVEDQKLSSFKHYAKQRGRWLESQFSFLKKSFVPACQALKNRQYDYFHKTLQLALPPRALAPFLLLLLILAGLFLPIIFIVALIGFVANISSYLLTIPKGPLFKHGWHICLALPRLFWSTIVALTWMKKSRTEFLHTRHQLVQS